MEPQMLYPLQLLDVRLFEAHVERLISEATTDEANADVPHGPTPFLKVDNRTLCHEDDNQISVFLTVEIKGPDAERPEFRLHFTLEGFFEAQVDISEIDEAIWQEFEQTSSLTLLWPYAREYTHSFSRRMRVDLPVLPTLNRLTLLQLAQQPVAMEEKD